MMVYLSNIKKQRGAASPGPSVAESPVDEFHTISSNIKKQKGAASPGPSVTESPVDEFHIKPDDQEWSTWFGRLATCHCDTDLA